MVAVEVYDVSIFMTEIFVFALKVFMAKGQHLLRCMVF